MDQTERARFRKIKLVHSINLELYGIRKIDGVLPYQKACRKDKEVTSIFETKTAFYLNKKHFSEYYIERNKNNCTGLPNVLEDISVSSPSCDF